MFFFFSLEHLPIHIHVKNANGTDKFEVDPVKLIESKGLSVRELNLAEALVDERKAEIIAKWIEIHGA